MSKKKVYIASPYSLGDVAINVRKSIDAFNELLELGFIPFAPLLTHFIHIIYPKDYDKWLAYDLEWLKSCDALLRLPGESKGADIETLFAKANNILVFYSIKDLIETIKKS
jgi:hypothetical protein